MFVEAILQPANLRCVRVIVRLDVANPTPGLVCTDPDCSEQICRHLPAGANAFCACKLWWSLRPRDILVVDLVSAVCTDSPVVRRTRPGSQEEHAYGQWVRVWPTTGNSANVRVTCVAASRDGCHVAATGHDTLDRAHLLVWNIRDSHINLLSRIRMDLLSAAAPLPIAWVDSAVLVAKQGGLVQVHSTSKFEDVSMVEVAYDVDEPEQEAEWREMKLTESDADPTRSGCVLWLLSPRAVVRIECSKSERPCTEWHTFAADRMLSSHGSDGMDATTWAALDANELLGVVAGWVSVSVGDGARGAPRSALVLWGIDDGFYDWNKATSRPRWECAPRQEIELPGVVLPTNPGAVAQLRLAAQPNGSGAAFVAGGGELRMFACGSGGASAWEPVRATNLEPMRLQLASQPAVLSLRRPSHTLQFQQAC